MICDFGDVVVVPFPFVDRPIAKRRPALVFSSHDLNADNGQTALAMITTASRSAWPSDIRIRDGARAGLAHASLIRWKLFTLPNQLVLSRLGELSDDDRQAVIDFTRRSFAPA